MDQNAENWCVQWGHHDLEAELPEARSTTIPPNASEVFAVAIDCEMGIATDGSPVILQLSVVDFFSGEVLVDNLISPSKPVASWQEKFSGINARRMEEEERAGRAFAGLGAARAAMFRFVGNNTIIVGHSAQCDLEALGISHDRVIDTHIVIPRRLGMRHGLKDLCAEYAKMDVQAISHDCLEDAFAVRAVVIAVLGDPVVVEGMRRRVEELERVGGVEDDERARMARVERVRAERVETWYKTQVPQRPEWLRYCQQFVSEHAGYHSYGY